MMKRSVRYASVLGILLAGSVAQAGQFDLPDYSAYADAPSVAGPLSNGLVPQEFLAGVGGVDEKRGVPTIYWAPSDGVVAPGGFMSRPEASARFYLEHYAPLYGLGQGALDAARVTQVHDTGRGGIIVVFGQQANGIDIHHTALKVLMTAGHELVAIMGNLHPMAAQKTARLGKFALSPEEVISRAFNDFFMTQVPATAFRDSKRNRHGYSFYNLVDTPETITNHIGLSRPARIKQIYHPMPNELVPAYYIELWAADTKTSESVLYSYVMAADDGRMLQRQSLTQEASFNYRVWADAAPAYTPPDGPQADYAPHPAGMPNGTSPAFVPPSLRTVDGFNTNPSMTFDPWLAAGATSTLGNNVDAYVDLAAPDGLSGTDFRAPTSSAGTFDYTYNTAQAPGGQTQRRAAITQLFYDNNYSHDYWYDSGFDEAAGNAQANNFGRGGAENDVLLAEAQDYDGTDNANMSTPADGDSPRMQMFIFSPALSGGPQRDGALDNGIVAHEWGHYLHNRLASGDTQQFGAMGEGWGDIVALLQLVRGNDNFGGTFATAVYAAAAFQDSAYYGIRRYPYSTNFQKNGLTFKHIGNGQTLPPGFSPVFAANPNSEVHNAGEIWCSMVWEAYSNLLEDTVGASPRHTFDQAKRKMADYLVAGLKLAPFNPTFTEQRDGIIAAVVAGGDAEDFQDIIAGFATRGAGVCAVSPPRTSTTLTGVVEDFTTTNSKPAFVSFALNETTPTCDNDDILDVGDGGQVTVAVQNTGWTPLNGASVTVTSTNPNVLFPNGNMVAVPATNAFATSNVTINVTLAAGITMPTLVPFNIVINAPGSCTPTQNVSALAEVHYDATVPLTPAASTTETFEGIKTWTAKLESGAATTFWSINRPTVPSTTINEMAWGEDVGSISDHTWESPDLVVGAGAFSLTFANRFEFERSQGTNWDGAVVEYSEDGGMTWADVNTLAGVNPGYNGTITDLASNPLANRLAYTGITANFATGAMVNRTINFGTTLANKTVRLRFRIGTDEAVGAGGWFIDNLAFTGLTNLPFSSQVNHSCSFGNCGNGMIDSGEACDDGNNVSGDCCSSLCQFEAAGTICRAATGQCDAAEVCNAMGACPANTNAPDGTACNDNDACTTSETCQAGTCMGGTPVTCIAQDACHVAGTCDSATGLCSNPNAPNGTVCDDGNACTMTDTCQTGSCNGANPVVCAAMSQCHNPGTCNPATGTCSNPAKPDGTVCSDNNGCTMTDTCQAGACTGANPVVCAAMSQCHDPGTCNPATGVCSNPVKPDGAACNDSNACTQVDSCQAGACAGGNPVTCAAQDACHVAGTCDPATGVCSNPNATDGTVCNDNNGCTQTDTCQAGACAGANPVTCAALDQCHVAGACDPATGMCSNPNAGNGTACDDNDACTLTDSCQAGTCTGTPVTCTAQDECHDVGTCNPMLGMCDNPAKPDGAPCTNGTCQGGTCETGMGGAGGMAGSGGMAGTGGMGGAGGMAGAGGEAGKGGDAGQGGTAGAGGAAGEGGAGGSAGGPIVDGGGCDCSIPAENAPMRDVGGSLLAVVGAWLARRRRSGKPS